MAKKIYIGVADKARKVKKMYFGVGDKARKVKKGYIGVGGVARLFFTSGLAYYGTAPSDTVSRRYNQAVNAGTSYLIVVGGGSSSGVNTNVGQAYNPSLTTTLVSDLSVTMGSRFGVASVGNYALITSSSASTKVDAYDTSLTRTTAPTLSAVSDPAGVTIGNYALFAGGLSSGFDARKYVRAYDTSLTQTKLTDLTTARYGAMTATVGNYAVIAGGRGYVDDSDSSYSTDVSTVETYNKSLTKGSATKLGYSYSDDSYGAKSGVTMKNYALFAGMGSNSNTTHFRTEAYNASLTKVAASDLTSYTVNGLRGVYIGGMAVYTSFDVKNVVNTFDDSLTLEAPITLQVGREDHAAGVIGNYMLLVGGSTDEYTYTKGAEVYTA